MRLLDTVALVTGAGHRLGRAIALGLAEAGCNVVVHYGRSREPAGETADMIRDLGREAYTISADLARPSEMEDLFCSAGDRFGRLADRGHLGASQSNLQLRQKSRAGRQAT